MSDDKPVLPTNSKQKKAAIKRGLISGFVVKLKKGKPKANPAADAFFGTAEAEAH